MIDRTMKILNGHADNVLWSVKAGILGVATWGGILLSNDVLRSLIISLLAIVALLYYRSRRKFRREATRGPWDFLDRNIVELILGAAIVPNAVKVAAEVVRAFNALP